MNDYYLVGIDLDLNMLRLLYKNNKKVKCDGKKDGQKETFINFNIPPHERFCMSSCTKISKIGSSFLF